jgi:hypothetical protein
MSKHRALICASVCGACLVGLVLFMLTMPPPISAPPITDLPRNYGREFDGFPVATTRGQAIVNECARAHQVNPFGTITAKQAEGVATCVDLIRSGRVTLN